MKLKKEFKHTVEVYKQQIEMLQQIEEDSQWK